MANFDTVWYTNYGNGSSTGYFAVAQFAASHSYSAGALIRQLTAPAINSERVFVCITGGTSGTEPTWTVTRGAKNTSTTPVFQECTGMAGVNGDLVNTPNWTAVKAQAITLGVIIQNNAGTFLFICSTAGSAGSGSEPSWTLTAGVTTADNTTTWTCIGAVGTFGAWAAPHARLKNAFALGWGIAVNTFFLGDNHAETQSTGNSFNISSGYNSPSKILSVDHTVSVPPSGSSALKSGASLTTTSSAALTLEGTGAGANSYYYGVTFSASGGLNIGDMHPGYLRFDTCGFTSSGTSGIIFGDVTSSQSGNIDLINSIITFSSTTPNLTIGGMTFTWRGGSLAGTIPTHIFFGGTQDPSNVEVEGVDLSAAGSGKTLVYFTGGNYSTYYCFKDCKLGASVTISDNAGTTCFNTLLDLVNCDSGATNYRSERHNWLADLTTATTTYRTGGFAIEGTALSWKILTSAQTTWFSPFVTQPILIRNALTGSTRNVKLFGIVNAAAVPNNDQFWFDVEYLGSASFPIGSYATGSKANYLASGSALTADSTSAWDAGGTARANTHSYNAGDIIKLASNPGRIFFCTTGGTSAGSEPGGYSTAIDGGSVTDNAAVFRAGCRFSLTVSLTANQAGLLTIYPKMAAISTTLFLDPLPILS